MHAAVTRHCAELDRCNQRGGRMLSVVDLLEAGSLDIELAAYLMARIARGASFMVGAQPGGAGKTTVMCALLNLVPADVDLVAATGTAVRSAYRAPVDGRRCYVCHEIGAGPYFAYLWGEDLRAYCGLGERGHLLATNLHADDLDEARDQVCLDNGVPRSDFNRFDLLVFLRVAGVFSKARRRIERVYASNDGAGHALVFDGAQGTGGEVSGVDEEWLGKCRTFLEETRRAGARTIEEVRQRVTRFLAGP